jgi:hypothetical protein
VTWPLPELAPGAEFGELSPPDEELPEDELPDDELPELDDPLELLDPPLLAEAACRVLVEAEPDDVPAEEEAAAPGRVNATAPAAMMLAAAAETVTVRSRALPRSLAATRAAVLCL